MDTVGSKKIINSKVGIDNQKAYIKKYDKHKNIDVESEFNAILNE